ncbi:MAG: hypothetical protein Q8O40_03270 [Chloroflexota bacterium]|nr:hypothetical protein [Chloroflexota bacterium]
MRTSAVVAVATLSLLAISSLLVACASPSRTASAVVPITLTMAELKGSTSAEKLAPPSEDLTRLSKGYGFKAPGYDKADPQKWEVASYVFLPSSVAVRKGDTVNLKVFGVNGDVHVVHLVDPDGKLVISPTTWNRGREYTTSFVADKAGVYKLICDSHAPTMEATFYVLPAS